MKDKPDILVVDDDPNIARLVELYLEKEGFAVRTAARGDDAVLEFRRLPPDMILLDVMLPGMDGYQVLKAVRKSGAIPVIMLTASADRDSIIKASQYKVEDYIRNELDTRVPPSDDDDIEAVNDSYLAKKTEEFMKQYGDRKRQD